MGELSNSESENKWSNPEFIEASLEGLRIQTSAHMGTWKLGEEDNWGVDMTQGTLTFNFSDGKIVTTKIQIIGTYNTADNTFLWGWEHPSVREDMAEHAQLAKEWGDENNEPLFSEVKVVCSEDDAWKMASVANRLANANGVYRGNSNGTLVYMTMGSLNISK